jgi:hypothetical protein
MMRALALVGCGALVFASSGCESTEEQSARIGHEGADAPVSDSTAVKTGAANATVRVSNVTLLQSAGRGAVAMELTSSAGRPQTDVPVSISVAKGGKVLYTNQVSGLESALQQMPLLRPHQHEWWVDDQVLTASSGGSVQVRIGASKHSQGKLPEVSASELSVGKQAGLSVLSGKLVSQAKRPASKVPVFAVALRAGKVTAAGRALISTLPPGATSFQIFLVGDPTGSTIQITVPLRAA